ncbi:MAG: NAD(P)/FAD-dependent oxidoreductase, partial [Candidatus Baltobacteraceae bacterium]
ARDRVGGRAWSRRIAACTAPAELGAEFIHGPAIETKTLLRHAGLATTDVGGDSWRGEASGELVRDETEFAEAASLFDGARSLAGDESVDRYLKRFDDDAAMRDRVSAALAFVEGFEAADPVIASARAIAQEWRSGVDSAVARPREGYQPLFEYLRGASLAAGVRISLSTTVRSIAWHRGGVAVEVRDGSGESHAIRARVAIVTLPAGVLRYRGDDAIAFVPELPESKLAALGYIEMGHALRAVLCFRSAFWERICDARYRDAGFFRAPGRPFSAYWTRLPVRSGLIAAWSGGPQTAELSDLSEEEVVERALSGFGALLGESALARREFEGGLAHDWSRDPFALGAYSYVAVGGGDARRVLGEPVDGTLFFAGEATATDGQGGTVNGALESGERAAAEAATALGLAAIPKS